MTKEFISFEELEALSNQEEFISFEELEASSNSNSDSTEKQKDKDALAASLAEQSLNNSEEFDLNQSYNFNRQGIDNGNEKYINDSISNLEYQKELESFNSIFNDASIKGDTETAIGSVESAKNLQPLPDAVYFNSLDTFRNDTDLSDDELLDQRDKFQALLSSSEILLKNKDKEYNKNNAQKIAKLARELKTNLAQSAAEHGNTLTEDIVKGIVNSPVAAIEGLSDTINTLLPDVYWKALGVDPNHDFYKDDVLPQFDTGALGDVTTDVGKFAAGMASIITKIPSVVKKGEVGLNAFRLTLAGTATDLALFDSTEALSDDLIKMFPSLENSVTNYLADRNLNSPWENKVKQGIEALGLNALGEGILYSGIKIVKGVKSIGNSTAVTEEIARNPIKTIDSLGSRDDAAEIANKILTGKSDQLNPVINNVVSIEDVLEEALPSIGKSSLDVKPQVGLSGILGIKNINDKANAIVNFINEDVVQVNRLSDSELEGAVAKTLEDVQGNFSNSYIADTAVTDEKGVKVLNTYIGHKETGQGFKTEFIARNQAEQLNADFNVIKNSDGTYYLQHKKVVKEISSTGNIDLSKTSIMGKVAVVKDITNPADFLPDHLLEDIGVAFNARNRLQRELVDPLLKSYRLRNSKDFEAVNNIISLGRDEVIDKAGRTGKWYSQDEFNVLYSDVLLGEGDKQKAWESYQAWRDLNDLQYSIENNAEYIRKATLGTEEILIELPNIFSYKGNGIVKDGLDLTKQYRMYDPVNNKIINKGEIQLNNEVEKYSNYKVIQLEEVHQLPDGESVKYFLIDKNNFKAGMLDPFQVDYRAGGRVIYSDGYFVKQASTQVLPDGSTANLNPNTVYTGKRVDLLRSAAQLENARNAYRSSQSFGEEGADVLYYPVTGHKSDGTFTYSNKGVVVSPEEADKIISKTSLVDSETMAKRVQEGQINLDHPFEVRADKELPLAYDKDNTNYISDNATGTSTWLMSNKRKKFAARGQRLLNPDEQKADILSPQESIGRTIQSIVNNGLSGNYYQRITNQFATTAKQYNMLKPEFSDKSPSVVYNAGKEALKTDIDISDPNYQALKSILDSSQRVLGYKSLTSKMYDSNIERFTNFMEAKGISLTAPEFDDKSLKAKTARGLGKLSSNYIRDRNPNQTINNFVYKTQFGINAAQFFTQASGAVLTAIQDPKKATQAMGLAIYAPLYKLDERIPLGISKNKTLLNLLGFEKGEDYVEYVNHIKKSGYIDTKNSHIDLAVNKVRTGAKGYAFDILDKVIDKSTIAMETGEMLNQNVAYRTAYLRFKELYPKADINSSQSYGWIIREADKLSFNMKAAFQSTASKNALLQHPLRFKNFFINTAVANSIGGKRTAKEKAAFWGTSTLLFGGGTGLTMEYVKGKFGIDDPKVIEGLENGMINYALTNPEGESSVDFSNTFDPRGISALMEDLSSGDTKLRDFLFGASGQRIQSSLKQFGKATSYLIEAVNSPETFVPLTSDAIQELAKISAGWSDVTRGYYAYNTGSLNTRSGFRIANDVDDTTALLTSFGFKSTKEIAMYSRYDLSNKQKKIISETTKAIISITDKIDATDDTTEAGKSLIKSYQSIITNLTNTKYGGEALEKLGSYYYFRGDPEASQRDIDLRRTIQTELEEEND